MKLIKLCFMLVLMVNAVIAQDLPSSLDQHLDSLYANRDFPGLSMAIIFPDGKAITATKGYANIAKQKPMKPDHRLLAGSIGKTVVAATALKLVEQQKLKLDEPISTYLGDKVWFDSLPNAREITVRMLMNHTSGVPEHVQHPTFLQHTQQYPDKIWTPLELVRYIFGAALFKAGEGWSYADTNYIILGMIMEEITGRKYYDLARELILKPSGIKQVIPSDKPKIAKMAVGYSQENSPFGWSGAMMERGKFVLNPQLEWTGGGYATTPEDLARWAKYLYKGNAIGEAMLAEMYQAIPNALGPSAYGLGIIISETPQGKTYGHSGWFPGYVSEVRYYPDHGFVIAIQFNTDDMRKVGGFGRYVNPIAAQVVSTLKK